MTLSRQPSPYSHSISAPRIEKQKHCKHNPSTPRTLPDFTFNELLNYDFGEKPEADVTLKQQESAYQEELDNFISFDQNILAPNNVFEETPSIESESATDSFELYYNTTNSPILPTDKVLENTVHLIDDINGSNKLIDFPLAPFPFQEFSKSIPNTEPETINPITFTLTQNDLPYVDTEVGRIYYNGNIDQLLPIDNSDSSFCADYHPEGQWRDDLLSQNNENTIDVINPLQLYKYEEVTEINVEKTTKTPKSKRERPQFTSTKLLQSRIDSYYNYVSQEIEKTGAIAKPKMFELGYRLVDASYFKNNIITPLLPNNADIEDFNPVQGNNGYIYEYSGAETATDLLALRWTHQHQNFYEPKIVRYRINEDNGKIIDKEALCPYCPLDITNGLDKCFHNINMSHYMHHVCKNHGVFSTGEEMPVPAFCEKGNKYFSYCPTCGEYQKLSIRPAPDRTKANDNGLISYFRHQYKEHNRTRKMRNSAEKEALHRWFNESKSPLLYEKEVICD